VVQVDEHRRARQLVTLDAGGPPGSGMGMGMGMGYVPRPGMAPVSLYP
jgi:hypothetical protein